MEPEGGALLAAGSSPRQAQEKACRKSQETCANLRAKECSKRSIGKEQDKTHRTADQSGSQQHNHRSPHPARQVCSLRNIVA